MIDEKAVVACKDCRTISYKDLYDDYGPIASVPEGYKHLVDHSGVYKACRRHEEK